MSILLHPSDPYASAFISAVQRATMMDKTPQLIQVHVKQRRRDTGYQLFYIKKVTLASHIADDAFYSPHDWIQIASRQLTR